MISAPNPRPNAMAPMTPDTASLGARGARLVCSPEELCRLINEELAQVVACRNSTLSPVRKLRDPRDGGCNWDSHALGAQHHFTGACLPIFARLIRDFQARYNLA